MNISELNDLDDSTRIEIEGFRTGTYLRLEVHDVPCEMVDYFDPCHPILVGGIGLGEENAGYMQVECTNSLFCLLLLMLFPGFYVLCLAVNLPPSS
jgi:hypothetical protein